MPDPKRERQRQNREAGRAAQLEAATAGQEEAEHHPCRGGHRAARRAGRPRPPSSSAATTTRRRRRQRAASTHHDRRAATTTTTTVQPGRLAAVAVQRHQAARQPQPADVHGTPADDASTPAKKYTATIETSLREDRRRARPQGRPEDGEQLRLPGPEEVLRRDRTSTGWCKDFVIQGGDPRRHRHRRPRLRVRGRAAPGRLQARLPGHGQLRARTPTARSSSS